MTARSRATTTLLSPYKRNRPLCFGSGRFLVDFLLLLNIKSIPAFRRPSVATVRL